MEVKNGQVFLGQKVLVKAWSCTNCHSTHFPWELPNGINVNLNCDKLEKVVGTIDKTYLPLVTEPRQITFTVAKGGSNSMSLQKLPKFLMIV